MHMLQCGRKAEIEILYSLKTKSREDLADLVLADLDDLDEGSTDKGLSSTSSHGKHPLLVYLSRKIHQFSSLVELRSRSNAI
jgi:hypothetical protein